MPLESRDHEYIVLSQVHDRYLNDQKRIGLVVFDEALSLARLFCTVQSERVKLLDDFSQ